MVLIKIANNNKYNSFTKKKRDLTQPTKNIVNDDYAKYST